MRDETENIETQTKIVKEITIKAKIVELKQQKEKIENDIASISNPAQKQVLEREKNKIEKELEELEKSIQSPSQNPPNHSKFPFKKVFIRTSVLLILGGIIWLVLKKNNKEI
ncbi:MAG: hypothetical protein MRERC_3c130 [Mycoplasmataceae bacterium RC_NB112A]|nr:MAG: hypothetical protein MRERC_3c130 [Mycoplasmataceae bacterium RC_NB112A]